MQIPPSGFRRARPLLTASPQVTKSVPVLAPNTGINAVDGLANMGPLDAIFLYNLIPSQYGCRVRTGYRQWCVDVGTGGVRTIIPFSGSTTADDALFACASDGIYSISTSQTSPSAEISFPTVDDSSGYGVWTNFTTLAGHFSLLCDEANGYYLYDEGTATWTKVVEGTDPGEINGADPADFVAVAIFKSRVWFVEKNSASAWYLDVGAVTGDVTEFNFGNKFKHGGTLVALFNWTVDGGEGVDDYLVAVSSGGDVIVYKGNDPDQASSFIQHGAWFIGPPPVGRRIAGSFGGELFLLSSYGLLPISKLLSGTLVQQQDIYITRKITPLINEQMIFTRESLGWEVRIVPTENLLLISVPEREGLSRIQFVQSLNNEAWALYRGIPYLTGDTWRGNFYIGSDDGNVYLHSGSLDDVDIDGEEGDEIEWSGLQVFQEYGEFGRIKRAQFIRPVFLAEQAPSYNMEVRYDYDLSEAFAPPAATPAMGAVWDVGVWDVDLWGGDFLTIAPTPQGAEGMGRALAVGVNGRSAARTILVRYDLMFDTGGLM